MRFEIKGIEPMGAVRMTTRGKHVKENAQRYLAYKQFIYYQIINDLKGVYAPIDAAIGVTIRFKMPIPGSWSIKQKEAAINQLHTKKPDIDNLVKGLFDSLNGLLWVDDNRIAQMMVTKVYSNDPGIELIIDPIGGLSHGQETGQQTKTKQRAERKAKSRAGRDIRARI
jgi:Holliday junction resolvase RusA-like endonuclease